MKAAGVIIFVLALAALFFVNVRARHHLPDKPVWGNLTFDGVDDVGRRYVRWMLLLVVIMVVDIVALLLSQ
jgi:hypothetical protein